MKVKEIPRKVAYWGVREATSWIAPFVALSSMSGRGGNGYLDNVVAAFEVPKQIAYFGYSIAINKGSRDLLFAGTKDLTDVLYFSVKNLVEKPIETVGAAAVIGFGVKYSPQIVKWALGLRKKKTN